MLLLFLLDAVAAAWLGVDSPTKKACFGFAKMSHSLMDKSSRLLKLGLRLAVHGQTSCVVAGDGSRFRIDLRDDKKKRKQV